MSIARDITFSLLKTLNRTVTKKLQVKYQICAFSISLPVKPEDDSLLLNIPHAQLS